jgi:hypothetical protein
MFRFSFYENIGLFYKASYAVALKNKLACLQRMHTHEIYVEYANAHSSTWSRW